MIDALLDVCDEVQILYQAWTQTPSDLMNGDLSDRLTSRKSVLLSCMLVTNVLRIFRDNLRRERSQAG